MANNQKGSAAIVLLVVLVVILAGALVYFGYFKKPSETAGWKTYSNTKYGFSFKYPGSIYAYDAVDYTNGQIPDVAYFGQLPPQSEREGWTPPPNVGEMGSARILVWTNVSQDLKTWVSAHEPNIKNWSDAQVGSTAALSRYSKTTTAHEGNPMTFKVYYLKTGSRIIEIMGFSVTNQYSDKWIETFDKVVATFKFFGPAKNSDWQTYRNEKYGFEFRYPVNLAVESTDKTFMFRKDGGTAEIIIDILDNPKNESPRIFASKDFYIYNDPALVKTELLVGNSPALSLKHPEISGTTYYIFKNSLMIKLVLDLGQQNQQIITTFKFTSTP